MSPQERASAAKELMSSQAFKMVMADLRERFVTQLESSGMDDVDTHHQAALSLQLIKQIRALLQGYVDEQLIEENRTAQETFMERLRERFRA